MWRRSFRLGLPGAALAAVVLSAAPAGGVEVAAPQVKQLLPPRDVPAVVPPAPPVPSVTDVVPTVPLPELRSAPQAGSAVAAASSLARSVSGRDIGPGPSGTGATAGTAGPAGAAASAPPPRPEPARGPAAAGSGPVGASPSSSGGGQVRGTSLKWQGRPRRGHAKPHPAAERRLREAVEELSGCLYAVSDFERRVLVLRTGLKGGEPLSRGRLARRLDRPREVVRTAERRGLRGLRRASRQGGCGGNSGGVASLAVGLTTVAIGHAMHASAGPSGSAAVQADSGGGAVDTVKRDAEGPAGDARGDIGQKRSSAGGADAALGLLSPFSSAAGSQHYTPWILGLVTLMTIGLLLLTATRRVPPPGMRAPVLHLRGYKVRGRRTAPACATCQSRRVAVNPSQGVYRCVACGAHGELSEDRSAGVDMMGGDS